MKLVSEKHRLDPSRAGLSGSAFRDVNLSGSRFDSANLSGSDYHEVDMSGCAFDDLNMSGWGVRGANLSGLRLVLDANLNGMTIDGIFVTETFDFWRAGRPALVETPGK